ncbi:MAG TPA: SCP2 sterol-binding domain-containing protein [Ramlibacter sp.]
MKALARGLPECPPLVAALLAKLPAYPGSLLLTTALNAGLAPHLPSDVAQLMTRRKFRIHVRDARIAFDFTWTGSRFAPLARQAQTDLTISASGPDFVRMARREEDPDTLFFSRRLLMEGDTELGLVVKNTLDALELPVLEHLSRFGRKPDAAREPSRRGTGPWA